MTAAVLAEVIGPGLMIVLVLITLLSGGNQLPELARSLGSANSEFEKGLRESDERARRRHLNGLSTRSRSPCRAGRADGSPR